ncbi:MAG: hypothetical protein JNL45_05025 [Hyphomicrobium sp.]|nr:hypothetical protein [Hyphomicrobium sp.]
MTLNLNQIAPQAVRYIKLGEGGLWEAECLARGIIRFGFGSSRPDRFVQCSSGNWMALREGFLVEGKTASTATRFANEIRTFFEDRGSILWITFFGERLGWGFLDASPAQPSDDGRGVWRSVSGGWKHTDINGDALTKERLAGSLTKLAAYRGTSCSVDVADYTIRRINGLKLPDVEKAIHALSEIHSAVIGLIRLLEPKDFELLVDLVFAASGWRRLGVVGKTQKTLDLDLMLPSTGERAFVQVKSRTTSHELAEYVTALDQAGPSTACFSSTTPARSRRMTIALSSLAPTSSPKWSLKPD